MANKKVIWQEKVSSTEYSDLYPYTDSSQVGLNNTINNNLGINVDSKLDAALVPISNTTKQLRAEGISSGNASALELSVPFFVLFDGVMARVKIHTNTAIGATLNVNNTGAKPIIRIDGEPIDLELKQGTWCIFIYSSTLDSWVFEGWSTKSVIKTAIFSESGTWTVPANVTSVDVFLFGGGGGSGSSVKVGDSDNYGSAEGGGGGSGYMAKSTLTVTPGQSIAITIGAGGGVNRNGGTTSFGTLLSAQGGESGGSGTATSSSARGGDGGDGGAGGGGGEASYTVPNPSFPPGASHFNYIQPYGKGGNGAQFGGGAGGYSTDGGNGGMYGGGGGTYSGNAGTGGQYGGNGGTRGQKGADGTNTINIEGIEFTGQGLGGTSTSTTYGGGGGGGYGGNGGEGSLYSGGGGGGYGGNGHRYGGGGGYGGNATGSGGGGYGASNYGKGGDRDKDGADGICIITWIAQEA